MVQKSLGIFYTHNKKIHRSSNNYAVRLINVTKDKRNYGLLSITDGAKKIYGENPQMGAILVSFYVNSFSKKKDPFSLVS